MEVMYISFIVIIKTKNVINWLKIKINKLYYTLTLNMNRQYNSVVVIIVTINILLSRLW